MPSMREIRQNYPQYNDISDEQLLSGLHRRFYSDMPFQDFMGRISMDQPAAPQPAPGSGSSFARGIDEMQGSLYSAVEGLGRATGFRGIEGFGREGRERNVREAEASLPSSQQMSFERASGIGENVRAAGQALGGSLPSSALPMGGALAGAAMGAPLGPVGAGIGAIIGGAAGAFPGLYGSNRARQIQESGEVQSEGRAAAAAIPQALAEGVVDRITLGLGRILGVGGDVVGRELLPRIARGVGVGAVAEVPAEVFQQAIERAQAGLDVLGPEAMAEYREAATAAAVVGGTMGGTFAGALGPRPQPTQEDLQREELRGAIEDVVGAREPEAPAAAAPAAAPVEPIAPVAEPTVAAQEPVPEAQPEVAPAAPVQPVDVAPVAEEPIAPTPTEQAPPPQAGQLSARRVGEQPQAETEAETEQADTGTDQSLAVIQKYLTDLRGKGQQGQSLANAMEEALADRRFNARQIYSAFTIDNAILKSMPKGADYKFKFVDDLVAREADVNADRSGGVNVGDRIQGRLNLTTESIPGFIEISLAEDMLPILNETAAHEAFHVLQNYFGAYDKSFDKLLAKSFKKDMTIDQLEPSIKRRLQGLKAPGLDKSYFDVLKEGLGENPLSVRQAQSYAFGALTDAAMRGQKVTGLTAPLQRFFNFVRDTFSKIRSGLRGDGYQTAADLLTGAGARAETLTQAEPIITEAGQPSSELSARRAPGAAARANGNVAGLPPFGQRVTPTTPASVNAADLQVQYDILPRYIASKIGRVVDKPKVERFFAVMQDKMLPAGRMIDDIKKAGGSVPVAMDTYLKEDLLQGKVADMLEKRNKNLYGALTEAISKSGINLQDFENYLYARHAKERNDYIASINPKLPDGGSGLTNAQAAQFMKEFQQQGKLTKMQGLARLFDKIIADTNKLRVDSGLTPDFRTVTQTSDGKPLPNYQSYAPLRGFADESVDADEQIQEFRPKTGKALGARGREDARMLGRQRKAGDILAHAIMQNTQAVIRSETNKVGQSFLDMVRTNPAQTKDLAEVIQTAPMKRAIVNGVVKLIPDISYKNDPNILVVKENGKEVAIRIYDENIAKAMTGASSLSPTSKNLLVQSMANLNRFLAKINTAYNPEFMITNFVRDLQTFGVNVQQYDIDGIAKDSLRDVKPALSGVRDSIRGTNNNPEMKRAFERFKELGGTTEMYGFGDLESRIEEINKVMADVGGQPKSWKDMAKKVQPVIKFLEDYNTIIENGIRTSLFKNLVDRGINEERAAQLAKNVTVNFSKGGEQRVLMNALYLFYNASLQGTMAMMNAIGRSPRVRKIVAGVVVAGVLQDIVNSMVSDVDDDEEKRYDKIPDYILKNRFVLMDPFNITERGYFSFPMPYGFNAFYNMGREMSKAGRGEAAPMKAAGNILGTFVDSFNPIGGSENFFNFAAPTILDPAVDIIRNRDFSGRPIVPERGSAGIQLPESQKYWNNTFAPYVGISDFLNSLTGGTRIIPGAVDISPNMIQYAVNFATGGVGKFVERSFNTVTSTIPGALRGDLEELDVKGIPFLRSLYGSVTTRENMDVYMERMEEVLRVRKEISDASQSGQPERVAAAMERYPGQVQIMDVFSRLSRDRSQISQRINEISRNANISEETKKEIIKSLRDQQNNLVSMANRLYNQNVENR